MKRNRFFILTILFIGCNANVKFPMERVSSESWMNNTLLRIEKCSVNDTLLVEKYSSPVHVNYGNNLEFNSLKEDVVNKLQRRKLLLKSISDSSIAFNTNKLFIIELHNKSRSSFYVLNIENEEFLICRYDEYQNKIEEFNYLLEKKKNTDRSYSELFNLVGWQIEEKDFCNIEIGSILNSMRIISSLCYENDSTYFNIESVTVDAGNY